MTASRPVVRAEGLSLLYGKVRALDDVSIDLPAGCIVGLIGPDGVGKSSLLALIAGARKMQEGRLDVLEGDMRRAGHRARICPRIAYMPQGLGRNLYPTLSVRENVTSSAGFSARAGTSATGGSRICWRRPFSRPMPTARRQALSADS